MSKLDAPVVIIGGGPAGLVLAIELAHAKVPVILCESQSYPIDKPCGEGIMPEGVEHLMRLGVINYLDSKNYSKFNGVAFINNKNHQAKSNFAPYFGLGIRRTALSQALYARASAEKNIKIINSRITNIYKNNNYMLVESPEVSLRTRLIIGADGLRSSVRKWANLENKERTVRRYGMRKHFMLQPWSSFVEVYFSAGFEAYVTPCGPQQVNVAFLWNKREKISDEPISYPHFLNNFPELQARLEKAPVISDERATGPLEHNSQRPISDGVALLGDACGYLDAITGEGNSIAMSAARALGQTITRALESGEPIICQDQLKSYEYAYKNIVKKYYFNTRILLYLASYPVVINSLISCGSAYPRICSWLIKTMRQPATSLLKQ